MRAVEMSCGRCDAPVEVDWVEIWAMGSSEPVYALPRPGRCATPGCGTTCPICKREPGDIHSGACSPFVLNKLEDPTRVSLTDCKGALYA